MKINDQSAYINFEAHTKGPQEPPNLSTDAAKTERGRPSVDKVVLSPRARELQEAKTQLDNLPDVNVRRVAQIQLQIEKGTYIIDGGKIAERMLGEMQLNSGRL
ncbi:MAG: flagellar biosynthesis anti-sigma factor FlgM [Desulfosarcina sp.]|nr:flagellar biosynthesis anti-sigma factor FlgM [Desulfobacterales bacterium]